MYFSGWIETSDPSTLSSGWIDSFAWHSEAVEDEPAPDEEGTFVVWLETNGELRKYAYDDVPFKHFNKLRLVARHGEENEDSVGATYTKEIKENKDIGPAKRMNGGDKAAPASEQ